MHQVCSANAGVPDHSESELPSPHDPLLLSISRKMGPPEGNPTVTHVETLEDQLQSKLRLSRCSGADVITDRAGAPPEVQIVEIARRVCKVRMVQQVEHLADELQPKLLVDFCGLRKAEVYLCESRAAARIAA